jgi:hypothetical protein
MLRERNTCSYASFARTLRVQHSHVMSWWDESQGITPRLKVLLLVLASRDDGNIDIGASGDKIFPHDAPVDDYLVLADGLEIRLKGPS